MKFNMVLYAVYRKLADPGIITSPSIKLITEQFEVYADTDIDQVLDRCITQLDNRVESFMGRGSGWTFDHFKKLETSVWELDPLRASTYHPLPEWVINTKGVVNVQNSDTMCFK